MINLSLEQVITILTKLRERIANGTPLNGYDDTTIGDKSTVCSWGLCNDDPTLWDKPEYHTWPDQFEKYGRVAPNDRPSGVSCPMDHGVTLTRYAGGCFWRCRYFTRKQPNPLTTKEQALGFYDEAIARYKEAKVTYLLKGLRCSKLKYTYLDEDDLLTGDIRNAKSYKSYDELVTAYNEAEESDHEDVSGWIGQVIVNPRANSGADNV